MAEDVGTVFGNRCFCCTKHNEEHQWEINPSKVNDLMCKWNNHRSSKIRICMNVICKNTCYRIDCNLFRDCIYRGRLWCNTDYMCSRRKPAWLFGIQCLSGTCVHGRYRITGIGWICCVDSVYAADATDYIDRCIYLSGRGAFCYYSGCKLQDNWKASI
mgnify:CR=1 FL=1